MLMSPTTDNITVWCAAYFGIDRKVVDVSRLGESEVHQLPIISLFGAQRVLASIEKCTSRRDERETLQLPMISRFGVQRILESIGKYCIYHDSVNAHFTNYR